MNEPIEDIFAEVCQKFDKMKKSASSSIEEENVFGDDHDVIEDPDNILLSMNNNRQQKSSLTDSNDGMKYEHTKLLPGNHNNNRRNFRPTVCDVDLT